MTAGDARSRIVGLAATWRRRQAIAAALHGVAIGAPLAALVWLAAGPGSVSFAVAAGCLTGAATLAWVGSARRRRTVDAEAAARHLDRTVPRLEDSCALALAEPESLPLLGRLQRDRVIAALDSQDLRGTLPRGVLGRAAGWGVAGLVVGGLILTGESAGPLRAADAAAGATGDAPDEGAWSTTVEVRPPAYTGLATRSVAGLDVRVVEGATLAWTVTPPGGFRGADSVELVFDEATRTVLHRDAAGLFSAERVAEAPHVYHLSVVEGGSEVYRSPFARLDVVLDRPPNLRVERPQPLSVFGPNDVLRLEVGVEAEDDYGLDRAALVATLASGTGEMVQFRERRLAVPVRDAPGPQILAARLDLDDLGLEPGAELYFHLEVFDNRRPEPQRTRTASWVARIPGPETATVALGRGLPIVRLPEYFRSQRQIIIDTEKLIEESPRITRAEFERRAQSIGFDQRALRLRYGTILGEQFESGVPQEDVAEAEPDGAHGGPDEHAHEDETRLPGEEEPDETEALLEGFVHEHDSEENATYFTTSVKQELRAALAAMWQAEGLLRTFEPRRALPEEYVALEHIKRVQQGSRVYVLKVGFEPPPIDVAAKRLTGDLDGIRDRRDARDPDADPEPPAASVALDALERIARGEPGDDGLDVAARELARLARDGGSAGGDALEALEALQRLREAASGHAVLEPADVDRVSRALWSALPEPTARPGRRQVTRAALTDRLRRNREDPP